MDNSSDRLRTWFHRRYDLRGLLELGARRTIPEHRYSLLHYLGRATLFLLVMQVATGVLLAMYYRPSIGEAHDSIRHIISRVPFGDLIRSVHRWSADLFVAAMILHLFSTWLTRAYRKPRELTWLVGCALLAVSITMAFTGYLLPWDDRAYFGTRVGTAVAKEIPLIGHWLSLFMLGGPDVGALTLTRFFVLHIALLPATVFILVLVHQAFVLRQGLSTPVQMEGKGEVSRVPIYPHALLRDAINALVLFVILIGLATSLPWPLGPQADPFAAAPAGIKPEWYFLFVFETLRVLPSRVFGIEGATIGIGALLFCYFLVVVLPFVDRRGRLVFKLSGWLMLAYFVGMTVYGWLA